MCIRDRNNADWLLNLNYIELLREVGPCFSVNNMLRAEFYKQRMEKGLSFLEFNYMIMQSYDFYYMCQHYGCNRQFGGDDQWSNMPVSYTHRDVYKRQGYQPAEVNPGNYHGVSAFDPDGMPDPEVAPDVYKRQE